MAERVSCCYKNAPLIRHIGSSPDITKTNNSEIQIPMHQIVKQSCPSYKQSVINVSCNLDLGFFSCRVN